jgi:serine/threonine protein kinase
VGEQTYSVTNATDVVGSPLHMSPEQARNPSNVDHRSDIWGMGATIFHALAGVAPWPEALRGGQLLIHAGREPPPHVQDPAPWVNRPLAEVVLRAMRREPHARFASAGDLAAALEPLSLMTQVTMADLAPLPLSMRGRIEDRAPAPDQPLPQRAPPQRAPQQLAPRIAAPTSLPPVAFADERRRAAERATWLFAVAVGLLVLVVLGGYLAWTLMK